MKMIEPRVKRIKGMANTVEKLSTSLKYSRLRMALCHTDIHNWNLMLVDWEGLKLAPVEADLMFLVDNPHFNTFLSIYRKLHKNYAITATPFSFIRIDAGWKIFRNLFNNFYSMNKMRGKKLKR
ncbi:hypothetical protein [Aneurinibacillus thermoaerophilus]|nr:hypothetical protein [Aneurinibacillus thermoaerophilus]